MGTPHDGCNETPAIDSTSDDTVSTADTGHTARPFLRYRNERWSNRRVLLAAFVIALAFSIGLLSGWQFGFQNALHSDLLVGRNASYVLMLAEAQREKVIVSVRPAVVQINVKGPGNSRSNGSGVIIDRRGYIVTNNHVIAGERSIEVVFYNGQMLPATLVGAAAADDLAVVKVDGKAVTLNTINLGDSSQLQVGQAVMAIGNPLGITQTVTKGIVSALGRNVATGSNGQILPSTIQTDAEINPGNSGGALVDMRGDLVGIPTLTAIDPEFKKLANGVGFAIPSNRIRFIVPQLIAGGHVVHTGRAALDAQVVDVDPIIAAQENLATTQGALVVSVIPGEAADQAGLRRGDIIVSVDAKPVSSVLSLSDALLNKDLNDIVTVKFYRGNRLQTLRVRLGELPAI